MDLNLTNSNKSSRSLVASRLSLAVGYFGVSLVFSAIILLLPLLVLFAYPAEVSNVFYFLIPAIVCVIIGLPLALQLKNVDKSAFQQKYSSVIVIGIWIIIILTSSIPFCAAGYLNFTQSVFEITSGYTTSGLTIVVPSQLPNVFLMFRSVTMYFGGIGLMLVLVAFIQRSHGIKMYNEEGHNDKILPQLFKNARLIFGVYTFYIVISAIIYMVLGMSWFDALNHSICAYATGGFSTRDASIASYNSPAIDIATTVFMFLGAINFNMHIFLLSGRFKSFFRHCENKMMIFLTIFFSPLIAYLMYQAGASNLGDSIRYGFFNVVSAFSTTGFSTGPDLKFLPSSVLIILVLLMTMGGSSESTTGGIKQYRISILVKNLYWTIVKKFQNIRLIKRRSINRYGNDTIVTDEELIKVNSMFTYYMLIFFLGSFALAMCGYSLGDSIYEFASALGNEGTSVGITGPWTPNAPLWIMTIGMFLGRLEIIVVFLAIFSVFTGAKHIFTSPKAKDNLAN
ncbi:MAG: TrkH family potassium uptake protein [Clostridiales bacterium]|jgi:trk system potassium uptake protein TrkH|nr:TrkH family potassium uptake protein [Clostridiales bacterium]